MSATQCERVLALSKRHVGVCQAELYDAPGRRGPITRLAARIQDLEDREHVFGFLHDRKGCRVYRWVEGPVSTEASTSGEQPISRDVGLPRLGSQAGVDASVGSDVERRSGAVPFVDRAATGQQPASSLSAEPDLKLFEPPVPSALEEAA